MLLAHRLPAVPRLSFAVVDVRDIAKALLLATERKEAAGNRYITANAAMWMADIAQALKAQFAPRGYKVPMRPLPYWAMWLTARLDTTMRLALSFWDVPALVDPEKAKRELGWLPRPPDESIIAAGESLIEHGIIPRRPGDTRSTGLPADLAA